MILKYYCDNEQCEEFERLVEVPPGRSADCPECGWTMTGAFE